MKDIMRFLQDEVQSVISHLMKKKSPKIKTLSVDLQ